uniref:Uncharacterized protein n=1 Tax=Tetradesmus obliquus TaxID=3088 RepID=A0A383VYI9_TETOB|eukprot:jgi/Sobl393_1/7035/SZX70537.1
MATRSAQWHQSYNPATHTGQGEPAQDRPRGVKITPKPATQTSNLVGAACVPAEPSPGSCMSPSAQASPTHAKPSPAQASPTHAKPSPAQVDHLTGGGCTPSSSADAAAEGGSSSPGRQHGSGRASPKVNLRAAVDHMHGGACAVQTVHEVATADAPLPQVARGMTTKLTKDRMLAQQAREHMHSSRLYDLGKGYTPVLLTGAGSASGSPREAGA